MGKRCDVSERRAELARILVVEDDHILQDIVVQILEHEGHECSTAANGRDGVELARKQKPDVVLMDLMMPVMSDVDAIRAIRRDPEIRDCQIIAMSAGRNLAQMRSELEVDSVLGKPFDIDALVADVAIHVRQAGAK